MRIVYFTDTYYPEVNGVVNTLSKLHQYLDDNQIEHLFFTPEYAPEDMEKDVYRYKGITLPFAPNSRLAVTLPYHLNIRKTVQEFQPDVIHIVTEFTMGQEGLHIARELGIPIVMSYHTNIDQYLSYFHAKIFEKPVKSYFYRFHSYANLNLCPSEQTLLQLEQQKYHNLDIWSRGVDTTLYSPDKRSERWRKQFGEDRFICLYVGRLSFEKGIDYYLDAIRRLNEEESGHKMTFVFAGDGPMKEQIENCNMTNVICTGFVRGEMLAELYADADAFVFPSGTETFGNVLLEAMASGNACICTNQGGVTDFALPGRNALVVPYQDSMEIEKAIKRLYDNPWLANLLREGARYTAKQKSWDSVMDYLMHSYETVIKEDICKKYFHQAVS